MAEQEPQAAPAAHGTNKILLLLIVGFVLMMAVTLGVAVLLLSDSEEESLPAAPTQEQKKPEETASAEAAPPTPPSPPPAKPLLKKEKAYYLEISPPFVVNLKTERRARYLQIKVALMIRSEANVEIAKENLPLIKHELVKLFSNQVKEEIETTEGREELNKKAHELLQKVLLEEIGEMIVERVLFSNIVIQ